MSRAALVVIDMINEIIDDNGKFAGWGYPAEVARRGVVASTNRAIARARACGVPVIFVRVGFTPGHGDCPEFSPLFGPAKQYGALVLGEWATEIHPAIDRRDGELVIDKPRVSALNGTRLEPMLRAMEVETVLLAGVATDLAVQTTARDAHDRDFRVVVLEDCCAASSGAEHEATIAALGKVARIESADTAANLA